MSGLLPYLLFFHVMGAIVAFGPTYAFGIYAGRAERDRAHIGFNNAARSEVSRRLVVPATLSMGVTGVLLIVVVGLPWTDPAYRWLQLSIVLYVGSIAWNVLVSGPRQSRVAAMGRALAEAREAGTAAGPAGPPPEMTDLIGKIRRDGKAMGVIVVVIVFLMIAKPVLGI